jgi:parallel beta-helix repeat protein
MILKRNEKKCLGIILLLITILVSFPSNISVNSLSKKIDPIIIKPTASWDLTGSPINIAETGPNDWAWAVTQPWCSGGGTSENPYLIENVIIDGLNATACITIEESSQYFVIKNCTLYNSSSVGGILLAATSNGFVTDCNISNNNGPGIDAGDGEYNFLVNNTINDNEESGIRAIRTDYITIYNNTLGNNYYGINNWESDFVNISSNIVYDNRWGINAWYAFNGTFNENEAFDNELEGLVFEECFYNEIDNNQAYNNSRIGIWCYISDYNNFTNNNVTDNDDHGLMIIECEHNYFTLNYIYENQKDGFYLLGEVGCHNNTFYNNEIFDNSNNGITLESITHEPVSFCLDNVIESNNVSLNLNYGIVMHNASRTTFHDNTVFDNKIGIKINSSDNSIITDNLIYDNTDFGLHIGDSLVANELNLIYNNEFNNPLGINAHDDGNNNNWDNGAIGNWYHDYPGVDANDDGIGDTPQPIPGTAGSVDNYPIFWDAPYITISTPILDQIIGSSAPNYDITIIGEIDKMWYRLEDAMTTTTNDTILVKTGTIDQSLWDLMDDGIVTLTFFANDTNGNIGYEDIYIEKDTIDPSVDIVITGFPLYGVNPPAYEFQASDINLNKMWYILSNGTVTSNIVPISSLTGIIDTVAWSEMGNGSITLTFYANDTAGNTANTADTLYKDMIAPKIEVTQPQSFATYKKDVPFSITVEDANLDTIWYTLGGVAEILYIVYITELTGTIEQELWKELDKGTVEIRFYANDTLGNVIYEEVIVTKQGSSTGLIVALAITLPVIIGTVTTLIIFLLRKKAPTPTG